jgi:hypothetical protein
VLQSPSRVRQVNIWRAQGQGMEGFDVSALRRIFMMDQKANSHPLKSKWLASYAQSHGREVKL